MRISIRIDSGVNFSAPFTFYPQLIDLTHEFGTGNEPTALTDNRIQNILNRGYIPFNLGEYKGTDIGVVSSYSYPPQLLGAKSLLGKQNVTTTKTIGGFYRVSNDGTWLANFEDANNNKITALSTTHKYLLIYQSTDNSDAEILTGHVAYDPTKYQWNAVNIVNSYSSGQFLSIKFATNYTSSRFGFMGSIGTIIYKEILLDLTELGLENKTAQEVFEMLSNDALDKLANGDTLNDVLDTITFKAQLGGAINSHDTMEIGKDNVVFTKNVGSYTFSGNETFGSYVTGYSWSTVLVGNNYVTAQAYIGAKLGTANYQCDNLANTDAASNVQTTPTIYFHPSNGFIYLGKSAQDMAGHTLTFELATPQVITIPRKHLGIYTFTGNEDYIDWAGGGKSLTIELPLAKKPSSNTDVANIYWTLGLTYQSFAIGDREEYSIGIAPNGRLYIATTKTKAQLQSALIGYSVFYETQDEVADITDTIDIESGGTITTDSEVLANIELLIKAK